MKPEPSPYLVALCRAHLLSEENSAHEDALARLLEEQAEAEGLHLDDLQRDQSERLRAEGALPSE